MRASNCCTLRPEAIKFNPFPARIRPHQRGELLSDFGLEWRSARNPSEGVGKPEMELPKRSGKRHNFRKTAGLQPNGRIVR